MAREIKTTIAVDGEAAFKKAINEANTSIRNMGSQLTLATAQFKKDGDAMKLMETRSKALKDEIGQQEEIVKALEKAVKDSSSAYGENSDKTEKWQAELNRAKAKLVNLQSELTLNNAGLDRNGKAFDDSADKAADYQATLETVGKGISFENVTSGISKITGGFESAVKKIFSFAKAMRDTMVDAGHWADDLMTDATKYNMDVEELQRWRNAADFIDTDVETIITARDKLSKKMSGGWTEGSGDEKKDMWELLGIDLHDGETGKMRNQMDVMFELGETLRSMVAIDGNDVRASELAMEVFGKSYRELLPLFAAGQKEWEKTVSEQRVVSKEHVEALGAMDDANNRLENSWETLKYTALAELAPVLTEATDALTNMLNELNDWMATEEGKEAMKGLSDALKELFSGLGDIKLKDAIDKAKDGLNALKSGLQWLNEHKGDVRNALFIIAGGFAGLKLANVALNIGKVVSGFQTLWAGANKKLPSMPGADGTAGGGSGGSSTGSGNGGSGATVLGALRIIAGVAAFAAPFIQSLNNHGNNDLYDENGNLTEEGRRYGYSENPNGPAPWNNREARYALPDVQAQENAKAVKEALEEELDPTKIIVPGLEAGKAEDTKREAAEAFWDALREYGVEAFSGPEMKEISDKYWLDQEGMKQLLDAIGELTKEEDWRTREDLPDWLFGSEGARGALVTNPEILNQAAQDMKTNTESGKIIAEKVAGADIRKFNSLPGEMQAACQRGAAAGVSGIIVRMDGAAVGALVAPYVNAYLGSSMG